MTEEQRPASRDGLCRHPLATRPIFYTDSIGGKQTFRDDLWAVTTTELNALISECRTLRERIEALKGERVPSTYSERDWTLIDIGAAGMRTMVLELLDTAPLSERPLNEVWAVQNKTTFLLFESQEHARAYCAQFGAAVGLNITNIPIFRAPRPAERPHSSEAGK